MLVSGERKWLLDGKRKDELVSFLTDFCAYTLYIKETSGCDAVDVCQCIFSNKIIVEYVVFLNISAIFALDIFLFAVKGRRRIWTH